jgi:hypothetical protein
MFFEILLLVLMISLCIAEAITVDNYLSTKGSARGNLVLCVINEIFLFSFFGEQIQHESLMISDKIYNTNWYELSRMKNKKKLREFNSMVQLTMMRANRSIKISAGGFTNMSFETFMSVSRFEVIRQLKNVFLIV